jgi:hypothetical protein
MALKNNHFFFDDANRMILTEDALRDNGIDLRANGMGTEGILFFNKRVSALLYGYISRFSQNEEMQKYWISSLEGAKRNFYNALVAQSYYMAFVGDKTLEGTQDGKLFAIDAVAMDELNKTIPELGCTLTYAGIY